MSKAALGVSIALFSLMFLIWWPMAAIWSLNTLFSTNIPYTLQTWASIVAIVAILRISTTSSEKR